MIRLVIIFVGFVIKQDVFAGEDFFAPVDIPISDESHLQDNEGGIIFWGELDFRSHYAFEEHASNSGFMRQDKAFTSLRGDAIINIEYQISEDISARIGNMVSYDERGTRDKYEHELDETYIDWKIGSHSALRIGRQLLTVGESSFFQVVDQINPLDERVFGLAELDEIKRPIALTRFNYAKKRFSVNAVFIQEFRPTRTDERFGDFDTKIAYGELSINESQPSVSMANPEKLIALEYAAGFGDVSLVWSKAYAYQSVVLSTIDDQGYTVYPEIESLGGTANWVLGNWLLKTELAVQKGNLFPAEQEINTVNNTNSLAVLGDKNMLMLGTRYSGINNLIVEFELLNSYIDNYDNNRNLYARERSNQLATSVSYEMLNEDLIFELFSMHWLDDIASISRIRLDYTLRDEWKIYGGIISYSSSSERSPIEIYKNNDRAFIGLTFNF